MGKTIVWHGVWGYNAPPSTDQVLEMVRMKIITKDEARYMLFKPEKKDAN